MMVDAQSALDEICFLLHKRNEMNLLRHRARYKLNYYNKAIELVEAHQGTNATLRQLKNQLDQLDISSTSNVFECARLQERISYIEDRMARLRSANPSPKKWLKMGTKLLRIKALQASADYALQKANIMQWTLRYSSRLKTLKKISGCRIRYDNGEALLFDHEDICIGRKQLSKRAERFLLDLEMESLIRG